MLAPFQHGGHKPEVVLYPGLDMDWINPWIGFA